MEFLIKECVCNAYDACSEVQQQSYTKCPEDLEPNTVMIVKDWTSQSDETFSEHMLPS